VVATVRTFVNPNEPEDVARLMHCRTAIKVKQEAPGSFEGGRSGIRKPEEGAHRFAGAGRNAA